MKNYAYLVFVDGLANHNKFYEIMENDDSSIDVSYGRVGGKVTNHHYACYEKDFYGLKQSKENKGYEDVTALHSTIDKTPNSKAQEELNYQDIPDNDIKELVELLVNSSREFMQKNYTITAQDITKKMIDEAERDLSELYDIAARPDKTSSLTLHKFNEKLTELFTDVPRKMAKVKDHLATSSADFDAILERERDMLDNVKGIIAPTLQQQQQSQKAKKDGTVLDAYGLSIEPVTYKEEDQILAHLGRDYHGGSVERRFVRAFKVENEQTRAAYEDFKKQHHITPKQVKLFYHGSKVENWWSITKQGLSLNPNASVTGKMFGYGLYFAPDCRKSLNYMDTKGSRWNNGSRETGYCAIYAVALGKCYVPDRYTSSLGTMTKAKLPAGCQSLLGDKVKCGLHNDEYVVYDQSQCTIKYLMEMTSPMVRELDFHLKRDALRDEFEGVMKTLVKIPNGVRAEFDPKELSKTAADELYRFLQNYDIETLMFDYNSKTDRMAICAITPDNEHIELHPDLTSDDMKFLCREMKKAFAESEKDWKAMMEDAKKVRTGELFLDKESEEKQETKKAPAKKPRKKKEEIERE